MFHTTGKQYCSHVIFSKLSVWGSKNDTWIVGSPILSVLPILSVFIIVNTEHIYTLECVNCNDNTIHNITVWVTLQRKRGSGKISCNSLNPAT